MKIKSKHSSRFCGWVYNVGGSLWWLLSMHLIAGKTAKPVWEPGCEGKGRALPRALVNSVPKSGTNLLASILGVMGLKWQRPVLSHELRWHPLNYVRPWGGEDCLIGVGKSYKAKMGFLRHTLETMDRGCYMVGHVPYQEHVDDLLQFLGVRTFFVIRDPRDVIVSLVHHVRKIRSNYLHWDYARLPSDKARLMAAICGLSNQDGSPKSQGIAEKLEVTLGWTEAKAVLTLRFEDLIGEGGGGDSENQSAAIRRIGSHLGWDMDEAEALFIGNEAFGKGMTYRRGMIGAWREVFDDELKETFKRAAGEYLIRLGYEKDYDW